MIKSDAVIIRHYHPGQKTRPSYQFNPQGNNSNSYSSKDATPTNMTWTKQRPCRKSDAQDALFAASSTCNRWFCRRLLPRLQNKSQFKLRLCRAMPERGCLQLFRKLCGDQTKNSTGNGCSSEQRQQIPHIVLAPMCHERIHQEPT